MCQVETVLFLQDGEIAMLGEITHLQAIVDDLVVQTAEPHKLPPASEQVRRGSDTHSLTLPLVTWVGG